MISGGDKVASKFKSQNNWFCWQFSQHNCNNCLRTIALIMNPASTHTHKFVFVAKLYGRHCPFSRNSMFESEKYLTARLENLFIN